MKTDTPISLKYLPPTLWAVFIFMASMMPSSGVPTIRIPHFDKIIHFGLYFVFAFLLHRSHNKINLIAALSITYGVLIELLQESLTATRSFDWLDVLANSIGVTIFIIFVWQKGHTKTNK